jgi:hypothetical protein
MSSTCEAGDSIKPGAQAPGSKRKNHVKAREATVLKVKLKLIRFSKGFDYGPLD